MFVRFRESASSLAASLVETRRADGKVVQDHVAALGSIACPMTVAGRIAFWGELRQRLERLANRIGDDQLKVFDAIQARIPMVTFDEMRALQRENAQADQKLWSMVHEGHAAQADELKALAAVIAKQIAQAEAGAMDAADKLASAKGRIEALDKGEAVNGGLREPMTGEELAKAAGLSPAEMRHCLGVASMTPDEFEQYLKASQPKEKAHGRHKVARKILRSRERA